MPHTKVETYYLKPSGLCFTDKPLIVTTVLGSCVAVTMYCARAGIACICHALLPECRDRSLCRTGCKERHKYVNCVLPEMVIKMARFGISPSDLEVKIFGGGGAFNSDSSDKTDHSVGSQNVRAALSMIRTLGLQLKKSDVGGPMGRKIYFDTGTGEVRLKRVKQLGSETPSMSDNAIRKIASASH